MCGGNPLPQRTTVTLSLCSWSYHDNQVTFVDPTSCEVFDYVG
jgi:hypothetical protein